MWRRNVLMTAFMHLITTCSFLISCLLRASHHICIILSITKKNRRSSNDHGEVNFAIYRVMCPDHVQINGRWNDRLTCAAALQRRVHSASRQQGMIYNSSSFHSNSHSHVFTRGLICRGAKTTEMHRKRPRTRDNFIKIAPKSHTRSLLRHKSLRWKLPACHLCVIMIQRRLSHNDACWSRGAGNCRWWWQT